MSAPQAAGWTRRAFIGGLTLTGMGGLLGVPRARPAAEPPPETTRLRLVHNPGICIAPYFVAASSSQGKDSRNCSGGSPLR
jgi:NitT/TauT family transport system substrate-binding protein